MMYRIERTKKGNVKIVMSADIAKRLADEIGESTSLEGTPYEFYSALVDIIGGND